MKYAMTFAANTAGYRLHLRTCSQAASIRRQNTHLFPVFFATVEEARAHADADEQAKGGERANFKVCKCAKG